MSQKIAKGRKTNIMRFIVIFSSAFLFRLVLLILLGHFVHGQEFTGDTHMHLALIKDPLGLLMGKPELRQHPPLLPVIEFLFIRPFQVFFRDFYALRLGYMCIESLAAAFFALTLDNFEMSPVFRRVLIGVFLLAPLGWLSSTVMAQDEVTGELFIALIFYFLSTNRPRTAMVVAGLGFSAAKIFLAVPILVLFFVKKGRWYERLVLMGALAVVPFLPGVVSALAGHGKLPLLGFTPSNRFGTNIWVFLESGFHLAPAVAKNLSSLLTLMGMGVLLWGFRRGLLREKISVISIAAITSLAMQWVFLAFYHVNPEYYCMVLPMALIASRNIRQAVAAMLVFSTPYLVNFFYGLRNAATLANPGGRVRFLDLYKSLCSLSPADLYQWTLVISILLTMFFAVWMTRETLRIVQSDS